MGQWYYKRLRKYHELAASRRVPQREWGGRVIWSFPLHMGVSSCTPELTTDVLPWCTPKLHSAASLRLLLAQEAWLFLAKFSHQCFLASSSCKWPHPNRFWSRFREKDWRQTAKVIFHQTYGLRSLQEVLGHGEICLVLLCFFSPPSVWYIFKQNFIFKIKVLKRWYLNYTPAI